MNPTLLTIDAAVAILFAPSGAVVAHARRRRGAWHVAGPLAAAIVLFVALSAAFAAADRPSSAGGALRDIALAHVVLATATLAFAAGGALAATIFADVLDAAGVSALTAAAATFALLVAGEAAGSLNTTVLNAALTASPFVAVASAGNLDILRNPTWYRLSPIVHRSFAYPSWLPAIALYSTIALISSIAFVLKSEKPS